MKRRQRARELPACLQKMSTPYLTTRHASRNNIRFSGPQWSVWPVYQSVFTHKSTYPIGRGKKRTGRVFSRLSHVQGPVEKNLCDEGWHRQHHKRENFHPRSWSAQLWTWKCWQLDVLFLAYSANRLSMISISRGSLVSKVRSSACIQHGWDVHNRGSGDSPWYTLSNVVDIVNIKGKEQRRQGAALFNPTSRMHTSSLITILEDILITVVHVLNHRQQRRRHASTPKVFP